MTDREKELLRAADDWADGKVTIGRLLEAIDDWREARGIKRPIVPKGPVVIQDDGT